MTDDRTPAPGAVTAREVASQPEVWKQALALPDEELAVLPRASESVLALGAGTSYYILDAYARRRQELLGVVTRAAIASELDELERFDRVLMLSRSGTTSDLVRLLGRFSGVVPTVCISGTPASPVVQGTDSALLIPFADEGSVVQTRFATTALLLLRRSIGDAPASLVDEAEAAIGAPLPAGPGDGIEHLVFLGTGWTVGLAQEASLKCREAALLFAEAYAIGEYRHGPIALAGSSTLVWSFSPLPPDVRAAIRETGARLVEAAGDPMAELPRVHRLALAFAQARGVDPDTPRHLSRSVVLDQLPA